MTLSKYSARPHSRSNRSRTHHRIPLRSTYRRSYGPLPSSTFISITTRPLMTTRRSRFGAQCECQCLALHAVVVVDELALIVRYRLRNLSRRTSNLHMTEPTPGPRTGSPPAPTTSREILAANLRTAMRASGAEAASLRDAVCEYVDAARQRGEPVERVIIDLKQEMRAAGVVDRYVKPNERALAESVIRWCIERYYGTAPRGD